MTNNNNFLYLEGITPEEMANLNHIAKSLNEEKLRNFTQLYSSRRKKSQDILIFTLLGFIFIAGVQRFVLGQIGMGIIYFFTGGFCLIGTIVDLINHKSMTDEFNRKVAVETLSMIQ
ncbi:TM2 domain-containing protein [Sphingobacterium bovistauri]|uniref:TM2 domain-containing protein n=1 Tax=Sphingobacterium bovistauri TaxID=2781959 RepID=A0ABS7Z5J7_9SPHI|nr:TM2 domain-containing protein [Sphingobacterium bovistauri]MCA5004847.1 TM2 domain-containing protein [Sphingobacterium bovistauri]